MSNGIDLKLSLSGLQQVTSGLQSLTSSLNTIRNVGLSIGGAALAFSGLSKIQESISSVINLGGELVKLRAQTQASIPFLIELRKAIKETGGDADSAGFFLNLMQRTIEEAATSGGNAERAFAKLNISLSDLLRMRPEEQFRLIAQRIGEIENPMTRAAIANDLFGKGARELLALFQDKEALGSLSKEASLFAVVMGRNADTLESFGDTLERIKSLGTKFFAGVLDMMPIKEIDDALNDLMQSFDFTAFGQRVGGFVTAAIDEWKKGRFDEFIALTIDAGLEQARESWSGLTDYIGGLLQTKMANSIQSGVLSSLASVAKGIASLLTDIVDFLVAGIGAAFLKIGDEGRVFVTEFGQNFKELFADVVNFFGGALEGIINGFFTAINKGMSLVGMKSQLSPVSIGKVGFTRDDIKEVMSFAEAWEKAYAAILDHSGKGETMKAIDGVVDALRNLLLIEGDTNDALKVQTTARERLKKLIEDQVSARNAVKLAPAEEIQSVMRLTENYKELVAVTRQVMQNVSSVMDLQRAKIAADDQLSEVERLNLVLDTYKQEYELIQEQIRALEERNALITDPAAVEAHKKLIEELSKSAQKNQIDQIRTAQQIKDAEKRVNEERVKATYDMLGNMATIAKAFGREGFIAYKAFAISQVTIDTAKAAMGAYSAMVGIPYVGPILAGIASAAAIGAGAAQIANIVSQQPPGYAAGGRPTVGQVSIVGERGPELFVPDTPGTILPNSVTNDVLNAKAPQTDGRKIALHMHMREEDMRQAIIQSDAMEDRVVEIWNRRRHEFAI